MHRTPGRLRLPFNNRDATGISTRLLFAIAKKVGGGHGSRGYLGWSVLTILALAAFGFRFRLLGDFALTFGERVLFPGDDCLLEVEINKMMKGDPSKRDLNDAYRA